MKNNDDQNRVAGGRRVCRERRFVSFVEREERIDGVERGREERREGVCVRNAQMRFQRCSISVSPTSL